jgi:hypothetical protein
MSEELSKVSLIDQIEADLANYPAVEFRLEHTFMPGMYKRKIFMKAGTILCSMRHKFSHPFFITRGHVEVLKDHEGELIVEGVFKAGHEGITAPGTKRLLRIIEDTEWSTVHANPDNISDPDEMVKLIAEKLENPLIDCEDDRFNLWKSRLTPGLTYNYTIPELEVA